MALSSFAWEKPNILIVFLAVIIVLIAAFLIYRYMAVPLYKSQNTGAVSYEELIGTKAVVVSDILEDGFGSISYIINDNKYNAPAKHLSNLSVEKGEEVIICKIQNNVFYVEVL